MEGGGRGEDRYGLGGGGGKECPFSLSADLFSQIDISTRFIRSFIHLFGDRNQ